MPPPTQTPALHISRAALATWVTNLVECMQAASNEGRSEGSSEGGSEEVSEGGSEQLMVVIIARKGAANVAACVAVALSGHCFCPVDPGLPPLQLGRALGQSE